MMQTLSKSDFERIANMENWPNLLQCLTCMPFPDFVAGGAIRRSISGESLKDGDIDLFFKPKKNLDQFKISAEKNYRELKLISEKDHVDSYTLTLADKSVYDVQLIKLGYYSTVEELLESFDYTISQFAYDPNYLTVTCGQFSLYDLGRKRIAVNKITYPVASLRRLIKYTNSGYYACNGCLQTYINELREIPDKDFKNRAITYVD